MDLSTFTAHSHPVVIWAARPVAVLFQLFFCPWDYDYYIIFLVNLTSDKGLKMSLDYENEHFFTCKHSVEDRMVLSLLLVKYNQICKYTQFVSFPSPHSFQVIILSVLRQLLLL